MELNMTPANSTDPDAKMKPTEKGAAQAQQVKFQIKENQQKPEMDGDGDLNPSISDPTTELTEEDIFRMKSMSIDRNGWKNGFIELN